MIDWNNPPTRPTRWQLIKSWWYWKVSSKYGFDDFVMYIVFPAMILGLLSLGYKGIEQKKQLSEICESKGGVLVSTHKQYICVDKKAILK